MDEKSTLDEARNGNIKAFHRLFSRFQDALASYLYRLTANREEAEDLLHDTYLTAFEKLDAFRGEASLKTWAFTIATNLARNRRRVLNRWTKDTKDRAKTLAHQDPERLERMMRVHQDDPEGAFFIREHISLCFTCISKTLPLDQQVALLLKDVYGFKVREVSAILERSEGKVKHLLHDARHDMHEIFDNRCALVSKKGACSQCTELNGFFNPKQDARRQELALEMVAEADAASKKKLLALRSKLVAQIDPLNAEGAALQEVIMDYCAYVNEG